MSLMSSNIYYFVKKTLSVNEWVGGYTYLMNSHTLERLLAVLTSIRFIIDFVTKWNSKRKTVFFTIDNEIKK